MFKLKIINKPKMIKMKCNIEFPDVVLANFQEKEVTPTKEIQEIKADQQYDGLSKVVVNAIPSEYIIPSGDITITASGTYDVKDKENAIVNIPEKQLGTKTITENGTYKATDDNLDGYSEVEVATTGVNIDDYFKSSASGVGSNYYPGIMNFIKKVKSPLTIVGTSMKYFFSYCNLEELPQINTSNVTDMNSMFLGSQAKSLDLSSFDTSNVTNMKYMFDSCENLKEIPYFDMSNTQKVTNIFQSCIQLKTIPKLNWQNVNEISNDQYESYSSGILYNTEYVENIGGFENLGMAYDNSQSANYYKYTLSLRSSYSSYSGRLTHESLMNIINNLYDIKTKGCNAQKLILGTTNINKLTSEEIAIATSKNWTVS